jgi:hypothetical protein
MGIMGNKTTKMAYQFLANDKYHFSHTLFVCLFEFKELIRLNGCNLFSSAKAKEKPQHRAVVLCEGGSKSQHGSSNFINKRKPGFIKLTNYMISNTLAPSPRFS